MLKRLRFRNSTRDTPKKIKNPLHLRNESVEIGVAGTFDVQVAAADIIDGFVVDHEGAVGVFEGGVGGEDGVVGLDDGRRDLRGGVDAELELRLLAVVDREALHEQGGETGPGATAEGVENQEALKRVNALDQEWFEWSQRNATKQISYNTYQFRL